MPKAITVSDASDLLRSRENLLQSGCTEREVRALVEHGSLVRVRRGWYVDAAKWNDLWNEGRHLVQVLAVARNAGQPGPVFCGVSAAVLLGFPLYRLAPKYVHTVIFGQRHGRTTANVAQHNVQVDAGEIVEVHGILCTSPERTVLDLACALTPEAALAVADAALREVSVHRHEYDREAAALWHARLAARADAISVRGVRQGRDLLAFADGRSQLPGESVSRLQLRRLGFTDVGLQTRVVGPDGENYWLDFAFRGAQVFGEFDGRGKYLDPKLKGERSAETVVLDEKHREDAIRGVTGWRMVRWGSEHIRTADDLGARLHSFGVRPSG